MKIKLPSADKVWKKMMARKKQDQKPILNLIENFLNGVVLERIELAVNANQYCVNVDIPSDAYKNFDLFNSLCVDELKDRGYNAYSSDDGAGVNNTIFISWEKKKTR